MKRMRISGFLLSMVIATMCHAQYNGYTKEWDGITYTWSGLAPDFTVTVTAVDESLSGSVTIPEEVYYDDTYNAKYPVTAISCTFPTSITSLTLSEGVTSAAITANGITALSLPSTLTKTTLTVGALETLTLPSAVTSATITANAVREVNLSENLKSLTITSNSLKDLTLPSSLTSLKADCEVLTAIEFPNSLTFFNTSSVLPALQSITMSGSNSAYSAIGGVLLDGTGTNLLYYPHGKPDINYTTPKGVTTLKASSIVNNYLQNLVLSDDVVTIESGSINCSNLEEITIPAKVTSVTNIPCSSLNNIWVNDDNETYCDIDGVLCSKDKTKLIQYPTGRADTYYSVPETIVTIGERSFSSWGLEIRTIDMSKSKVEEIESSAFRYCQNLSSVIFSPSLKSIGTFAFQRARFTTLNFPDGLESIGTGAFNENWYLTSVNWPESLISIGAESFAGSKIAKAYIPKNMKSISGAFNGSAIAEIEVSNDNPYFSSVEGVVYSKQEKTLIAIPPKYSTTDGSYSVIEGCDSIGANFGSGTLRKIIFPISLKYIAPYANISISTVIFTEGCNVTNLPVRSFGAWRTYQMVQFPSSINNVAVNCFEGCKVIRMDIPDNSELKNIRTSSSGFASMDTLFVGKNTKMRDLSCTVKYLYVDDDNTDLTSITTLSTNIVSVSIGANCGLTTIAANAFKNCTNLRNIHIGENCALTTIAPDAFLNCSNLQEIDIPENVATIGSAAFANCTSLEKVTFLEPNTSLTNIGDNSFYNCGFSEITMPSSLQRIERQAFSFCEKLKQVGVPASTDSIAYDAFYHCENLTHINVDKENPKYASSDGFLCNKTLEELVIFPAGKANEKFILLPPSLQKIGAYSFFDCRNLYRVMLPKKVASIHESAFWGCSNLKEIILLQDNPISDIKYHALPDGIATQATLWVRERSKEKYEAHEVWGAFADMRTSFTTEDGIEYMPVSTTNSGDYSAVDILSVKKPDHTLILPETVEHDGKEYSVDLLGDYAFEDCTEEIREVVLFRTLDYIGARAFISGADEGLVQNVFLVADEPAREVSMQKFEMPDEYNEFTEKQHVYVRKSAYVDGGYREKWWRIPNLDYRIKGDIAIKGTYFGTFSREFDVLLGDTDEGTGQPMFWDEKQECPKVIAFTGFDSWNTDDPENRYVKMTSINNGAGRNVDGLYIPAGTGVLLKAVDGTTPEGYYYQIGEQGRTSYGGGNVMQEVTVNSRRVDGTEDARTNFYVSKGSLHRWSGQMTMPVHRSYMSLSEVPAGAKVMMVFDDTTTDIEALDGGTAAPWDEWLGAVYDLQGRKLADGQAPNRQMKKGIYVVNGHKVVVR